MAGYDRDAAPTAPLTYRADTSPVAPRGSRMVAVAIALCFGVPGGKAPAVPVIRRRR